MNYVAGFSAMNNGAETITCKTTNRTAVDWAGDMDTFHANERISDKCALRTSDARTTKGASGTCGVKVFTVGTESITFDTSVTCMTFSVNFELLIMQIAVEDETALNFWGFSFFFFDEIGFDYASEGFCR